VYYVGIAVLLRTLGETSPNLTFISVSLALLEREIIRTVQKCSSYLSVNMLRTNYTSQLVNNIFKIITETQSLSTSIGTYTST
jgi:hypothetical protein